MFVGVLRGKGMRNPESIQTVSLFEHEEEEGKITRKNTLILEGECFIMVCLSSFWFWFVLGEPINSEAKRWCFMDWLNIYPITNVIPNGSGF